MRLISGQGSPFAKEPGIWNMGTDGTFPNFLADWWLVPPRPATPAPISTVGKGSLLKEAQNSALR
jgi:hypothetical protein